MAATEKILTFYSGRYEDGSGYEYAVRAFLLEKDPYIELECLGDTNRFPLECLNWLIETLDDIHDEIE